MPKRRDVCIYTQCVGRYVQTNKIQKQSGIYFWIGKCLYFYGEPSVKSIFGATSKDFFKKLKITGFWAIFL